MKATTTCSHPSWTDDRASLGGWALGHGLSTELLQGEGWIPDQTTGQVLRVDRSGRVLGRVASGLTAPYVLCAYEGAIWTADYRGSDIVRIDPSVAKP